MSTTRTSTGFGDGHGGFADTHWSIVLVARQEDSPQATAALEKLCRTYWRPLYAFIRREGHGVEDAQDLTQEFFARLVEKKWLSHLVDQRGKFRSFLLTFLKHFLSDQRDRAGAQKRGGGRTVVSLDEFAAEERALFEPVEQRTAEQVFERRWAQTVMEQAKDRLRQEYIDGGKGLLFDLLKEVQPGEHGALTYAQLGAPLGLTEQAVKSAIHRLRRRHREILRKEIAQTVGSREEIDEEIQHLIGALGH